MTDDAAGNDEEPQQPEVIEGFDLPADHAETGLEAPVVDEAPSPIAVGPTLRASAAERHVRAAERPASVKGKRIALVITPLLAVAVITFMMIRRTTVLGDFQGNSMEAATTFMKGMSEARRELTDPETGKLSFMRRMSEATQKRFDASVALLTVTLRDAVTIEERLREFNEKTESLGTFTGFRDIRWVVREDGTNYDEFSASAVFERGARPVSFRFSISPNASGGYTHLIADYRWE
jgi:hypothetical protein